MADRPIIHILGAGALGSLWATKLSYSNDVVLLVKGRKQNQNNKSDTASHQHFQFIDQNQTSNIKLACEYSPPSSGNHSRDNHKPINTLLVFTKSYDTLNAVKQIQHRTTPSTHIVLFQNGMGSQQAITELLPANKVYAASTTEGANRPDRHTVIYAGKGETWVGAISNEHSNPDYYSDSEKISNLLSSAGLMVFNSQNIWQKLWLKLAINCAINPFTALLSCKNGELIGQPLFDRNITPLCHELSLALKINNIEKSANELRAIVEDVIIKTANNVSSMLQDVRAGKQTEIEYINGYIETIAQKSGHHFPVNLSLLEKVRKQFH